MNNNMTTNERSSKLNGNTPLFSQDSVKDLSESVNKMTDKMRTATEDAVTQSIDFAKKYPVYTFLGAMTIGIVIGLVARSVGAAATNKK
jgi:ElaB/YqjD/DUF883 family membrane-anchored ribosome-binding protein